MSAHLPSLPSIRVAWPRRAGGAAPTITTRHSPGLTGCAGGSLRPRASQQALADALRAGRL